VNEAGLPAELPQPVEPVPASPLWQPLTERLRKLGTVRGATADWIAAGW
jgi:hypothetical protein